MKEMTVSQPLWDATTDKVYNTIKSCKTPDQLRVAMRFLDLYLKRLPDIKRRFLAQILYLTVELQALMELGDRR